MIDPVEKFLKNIPILQRITRVPLLVQPTRISEGSNLVDAKDSLGAENSSESRECVGVEVGESRFILKTK